MYPKRLFWSCILKSPKVIYEIIVSISIPSWKHIKAKARFQWHSIPILHIPCHIAVICSTGKSIYRLKYGEYFARTRKIGKTSNDWCWRLSIRKFFVEARYTWYVCTRHPFVLPAWIVTLFHFELQKASRLKCQRQIEVYCTTAFLILTFTGALQAGLDCFVFSFGFETYVQLKAEKTMPFLFGQIQHIWKKTVK